MNNQDKLYSIFDRSGIASLDDVKTPQWKTMFQQLERDQIEFLVHQNEFRSEEYKKKWPSDALHWWSRIWEYPYVMHNIKQWYKKNSKKKKLKVVDLGSGVTFFPFSIARLGLDVCCVDNDKVCEKDLIKAIETISVGSGSVSCKFVSGLHLPFRNNEVDAIYCISVLEHIPDFEKTISEMNRILKPGGLCIITIDIDLLGNSELGTEKYEKLRSILEKHFHYRANDRTIHPTNILNSNSGPFPMPMPSVLLYLKAFMINKVMKPLMFRKGKVLPPRKHLLAVQGFVLSK